MSKRDHVSISKSALLLSPCIAWADPSAKWYDDRFTDTEKRDQGTEFHREIDKWLKSLQKATSLN